MICDGVVDLCFALGIVVSAVFKENRESIYSLRLFSSHRPDPPPFSSIWLISTVFIFVSSLLLSLAGDESRHSLPRRADDGFGRVGRARGDDDRSRIGATHLGHLHDSPGMRVGGGGGNLRLCARPRGGGIYIECLRSRAWYVILGNSVLSLGFGCKKPIDAGWFVDRGIPAVPIARYECLLLILFRRYQFLRRLMFLFIHCARLAAVVDGARAV